MAQGGSWCPWGGIAYQDKWGLVSRRWVRGGVGTSGQFWGAEPQLCGPWGWHSQRSCSEDEISIT